MTFAEPIRNMRRKIGKPTPVKSHSINIKSLDRGRRRLLPVRIMPLNQESMNDTLMR